MRSLFDKAVVKFTRHLVNSFERAKVRSYEKKYSCKINFVNQGFGGIEICGEGNFYIDPTSHLKSGTFIDCAGGVSIGSFFHVGKGLSIFSHNHNWRSRSLIPYDSEVICKPVEIGCAVWIGANVTIMPGTRIGNGAIIGGGSVLRGEIPAGAIVIGNPCVVVGSRDMTVFNKLASKSAFF